MRFSGLFESNIRENAFAAQTDTVNGHPNDSLKYAKFLLFSIRGIFRKLAPRR